MTPTMGVEPKPDGVVERPFPLGLTQSMRRRIEDLVHTSGDFCVCGGNSLI
jgi:hypothetical protein